MSENSLRFCTAFVGADVLARGALSDVTAAVKAAWAKGTTGAVLVFDDATGRVIDLDLREGEVQTGQEIGTTSGSQKGRGRPKLGVVAREVTLLPRHWEWLSAQSGGASVVLRRLVDEARRVDGGRQQRRVAQESAYHFMAAMAGDLPGFEEACRALFADQADRFRMLITDWPVAVRTYADRLGFGDPS
jgi:hypothetical protein